MEQLYVFGTGHAAVTQCYNTCFAIKSQEEYFMTDAGGGNGILRILKDMDVSMAHIHHIFVTHEHTDHILGIIWMVRIIGSSILSGKYKGDLNIYCHNALVSTIDTLCRLTLQDTLCRLIGDRIHLNGITDGDRKSILGLDITFFDIHSTKATQYGFTALLNSGKKITCCGDEPYNPACEAYVQNSTWLFHEAFCLYKDRERFKPYEKHHSTVKDACELAQKMGVKNLVLWHTEDTDLAHRKEAYLAEGLPLFSGTIFVPDDREILTL